jgi:hypothetical protein
MAWKGKMSRRDYARSNTHLEFQSIQRTREFFRNHPLPPTATSSHYNELLMRASVTSSAICVM